MYRLSANALNELIEFKMEGIFSPVQDTFHLLSGELRNTNTDGAIFPCCDREYFFQSLVFNVVFELTPSCGMPQSLYRLFFYLSDSFLGEIVLITNLFK